MHTRKVIDAKRLEIAEVERTLQVPVTALPEFNPKEPALNDKPEECGLDEAISTQKVFYHKAATKHSLDFEEEISDQIDAKRPINLDILEPELYILKYNSNLRTTPPYRHDSGEYYSAVLTEEDHTGDKEKGSINSIQRYSREELCNTAQVKRDADEKWTAIIASREAKNRLGAAKAADAASIESIQEAAKSSENATNNADLKCRLSKGKSAKVSNKFRSTFLIFHPTDKDNVPENFDFIVPF